MVLRNAIGNMYPWVTYLWNPIFGWPCPHKCSYCYVNKIMERIKKKPTEIRLNNFEMETDLGSGNTIFVGSSCDIWADKIPKMWIELVLDHCREFSNAYVFQSKNPKRFLEFTDPNKFPKDTLLGITMESNRSYDLSKAPSPSDRYNDFLKIKGFKKFISAEPIMDFDLDIFSSWLINSNLSFISIGADSKGNKLPEPPSDKVKQLIDLLKGHTAVKIKPNLDRFFKAKRQILDKYQGVLTDLFTFL